jgi:hypothetical protein
MLEKFNKSHQKYCIFSDEKCPGKCSLYLWFHYPLPDLFPKSKENP